MSTPHPGIGLVKQLIGIPCPTPQQFTGQMAYCKKMDFLSQTVISKRVTEERKMCVIFYIMTNNNTIGEF